MNENMSHIEICARLNFLENHTRYLASELVTEKEKSYEKSVEIKDLKYPSNLTTYPQPHKDDTLKQKPAYPGRQT